MIDDVLRPGGKAMYRGALVEILAIGTAVTPTGGTVSVVKIRRPRAGERYVFPTELRPGFRLEEPDRGTFRR